LKFVLNFDLRHFGSSLLALTFIAKSTLGVKGLKTFSIYLELSGKKTVKQLTCEKRKYELTDSKPLQKCQKACDNNQLLM